MNIGITNEIPIIKIKNEKYSKSKEIEKNNKFIDATVNLLPHAYSYQ